MVLPGATEAPRDDLRVQVEVYEETILLRGFENDSAWVRTVSADGIASVLTQHLGSPRGCCRRMPSGGTKARPGQVVGLWRPPQVWSGGPCNGRRSSLPPGSGSRCRAGLRLLAGRAPWVYAAVSRPADAEQQLFRAPAFNVFHDGRVCPGSHRFPEEWD